MSSHTEPQEGIADKIKMAKKEFVVVWSADDEEALRSDQDFPVVAAPTTLQD